MILGTHFFLDHLCPKVYTVLGEEDGERDERKGMEEGGEESGRG